VRKSSTVQLLLLLILILLVSACQPATAETPEGEAKVEPTPEEEVAVPVEVGLVETGDINLVFSYSGSIQPESEINLIPGANGRVETLLVEIGDEVEAGEVIATIEDETYMAQIEQAEAALALAQLSLAKMELGSRPEEIAAAQAAVSLAKAALNDVASINDNERTRAAADLARAEAALKVAQAEYDKIAWAGDVGSTPQAATLQAATIAYETALSNYNLDTNPSDSQLSPLMLQLAQAELNLSMKLEPYRQIDFEQARIGIRQAEAALDLANLQLAETEVKAPFDGVVAELFIEEGSRVGPQTPALRLVSKQLEAVVDVQESLISQVETGQNASLRVTAYPGQDFPGVVSSVAPTANPETRTFAVKVTPSQGAELLRGGMFAEVSILAQEKPNTLLAPRAAVVQAGANPYVYVINEDNVAEQRPVTTGLFDDDRVEILSGLKEGEAVVTAGQANLEDGLEVAVTNDPRLAE
jgi:HlyD family secretion protein